jgi:hypothetical protein
MSSAIDDSAARQKQKLMDRVGDFTRGVVQTVLTPAIQVFDWVDAPTRATIEAFEAKRAELSQKAKECVAPVVEAVNSLGIPGCGDLNEAIGEAKTIRSSLLGEVAKLVTMGTVIVEPMVEDATKLLSEADAAALETLEMVKKSAIKSGWPVEAFRTEHEFLYYCRSNVKYREAAAKVEQLHAEQAALREAFYGFVRKAEEIREAAAKAALAELNV